MFEKSKTRTIPDKLLECQMFIAKKNVFILLFIVILEALWKTYGLRR